MKITADEVSAIALGGAFLATGGGGDTLIGEILAETALETCGGVDLVALQDLRDDATVVAIGAVGSPTVMQEKPSNGDEPLWALKALETFLGRKADALIAFEAGGVNALAPLCAAAAAGIPVVDADGMGRAFPELQMESFSIYGVSATPLAAAAELGDSVIIDHARNSAIAEKLVRNFAVVAGGGQCTSAEHVMDGATAKRVSIDGTISLCKDIGDLIVAHGARINGFVSALTNRLAPTHYGAVKKIFEGKLIDIDRRVEGGYDFAVARFTPLAASGSPMTIHIKNEYLYAEQDGRPMATTPDLICMLDLETGRPITAETLRFGQRVAVIAVGAPALMRTERALQVVSPRNFGFDVDYVPIETLANGDGAGLDDD
ncbi:MAG: DUF917 domain-containing protein [Pseudomonadota bacterium]